MNDIFQGAARESLNFPSTGYDKRTLHAQVNPFRVAVTRCLFAGLERLLGFAAEFLSWVPAAGPKLKLLIWSLRLSADRVILTEIVPSAFAAVV